MSYTVKEMYYTLQGEGAQTGRAAVFCRFAGCNLWTGRESDRTTAICQFCDTDFVGTDGAGGGKFDSADRLADAVACLWPEPNSRLKGMLSPEFVQTTLRPLVVCTGGEPLLQLDESLIHAFHVRGFEVAVETNGTCAAPEGLDWICVSPKAGAPLVLQQGHELKLVYPQSGLSPESFVGLAFQHFFLQPKDGPLHKEWLQQTVAYCLQHPHWRLSLQTHKWLNIP